MLFHYIPWYSNDIPYYSIIFHPQMSGIVVGIYRSNGPAATAAKPAARSKDARSTEHSHDGQVFIGFHREQFFLDLRDFSRILHVELPEGTAVNPEKGRSFHGLKLSWHQLCRVKVKNPAATLIILAKTGVWHPNKQTSKTP